MDLVERHRELDTLQELFARCRRGHGQIALLTGSVASGKTELLNTFADTASANGAVVLTATASRAEQPLQLGVMDQLLRQVTSTAEAPRNVQRLLEEPDTAGQPETDGEPIPPPDPQVMRALSGAVLGIAADRPVVLGVDDVQFADSQSLQTLLYIQRRMRSAPVLMILTEWSQARPGQLPFHTEVARLPYFSRLRLAPLSPDGVAELLAQHFDPPTVRQLTPAYYQTSGGNPLLVHALIEDYLSIEHPASPGARAAPVVGESFGQAVLACLHRWEFALCRVARGLALLGDAASPHRLGRLLGMTADSATQVLDVLTTAGLAESGTFRHPRARAAVLRALPPSERSALHVRAAELLYQDGESPTTVAGHLIAADRADDRWAVNVLRGAAEIALEDDEEPLAAACLELAQRECTDERDRAVITELLARAEWRSGPANADLRINGLRTALRDGHLSAHDSLTLVKYLLWHSRAGEAADVLRTQLSSQGTRSDRTDLQLAYLLLSFSHPPHFPSHPDVPSDVVGDGALHPAEEPWRRAAAALGVVLTRGPVDSAVGAAEHILQTCAMTDRTLETLLSALLALMYADHSHRAALLCDSLLEEAGGRRATVWRTQFRTLRSDIAMRLGDPLLAAEHARAALDALSATNCGIGIATPLSTAILATTAMGDLGEAAALLKRPVPEDLFRTWFGPAYLYARGQYFLAAGRTATALRDFHQCGALMSGWAIDHPSIAPWRSGVAQAQLLLGRADEARKSAEDQLALPGAGLRTRGVSLRLLAESSSPERRVPRLEEATEMLSEAGDRLELAVTLGALAEASRARGAFTRAGAALEQAMELARGCHAAVLQQQLVSSARHAGGHDSVPRESDGLASLSRAERRVASLAGLGHTNRTISRKLGITVSTVEQHLTRVYRKLNVQSRAELPTGLPLRPVPTGVPSERACAHGPVNSPHQRTPASNC
ncbi:helix-turn-helix transcriptional regulator [Saccharomonospora piscinae]|uniref:helix-turn-helix transcriptional regulator n=1 Tax=Saccharomonospora piscinae TaxID=687388 RepID=UPI001106380C|nr:LuxR family transcriptional regulator [Saccharomonospora piscinae]TLW91392.1 helix-turn-helix transcriptional regulator [Saccharomonospora piscinae]